MLIYTHYSIYLIISIFLSVYVGKQFYSNGYFYILDLFNQDQAVSASTNNILLICYYLVNIGYIVFALSTNQIPINLDELIHLLCKKIGFIICILAALHCNNLFILYLLRKKNI